MPLTDVEAVIPFISIAGWAGIVACAIEIVIVGGRTGRKVIMIAAHGVGDRLEAAPGRTIVVRITGGSGIVAVVAYCEHSCRWLIHDDLGHGHMGTGG